MTGIHPSPITSSWPTYIQRDDSIPTVRACSCLPRRRSAARHRASGPQTCKMLLGASRRRAKTRDLARLRSGVALDDFITLPCAVIFIEEPGEIWPRDPPIRTRRAIPTCWLEIAIVEGKNRQVRRMTAAIGFPTLRLIRHSIEPVSLGSLEPGRSRAVEPAAIQAIESHYAAAREVPGRGSFAPRKRSPLPRGENPRTSPRRRTDGPRS